MKTKLGGLFLLLMVGCTDGEKVITDKVKSQLSDPMSAQFQEVEYFIDDKNTLGCGSVNAKNKMGGYVGFTGFMLWQGQMRFAADSDYHPRAIFVCCLAVKDALEKGLETKSDAHVTESCRNTMTTPFDF